MENAEPIEVEVAYARPDTQVVFKLKVNPGARVEDAIKLSGILHRFPEINLAVNEVGVFGKLSRLNALLKPGDRVEIYRPLIADPKEVRRQRARRQ
jgi:putative ubiquitin-RnfH superfamily antitoxin RatB of RatAB toxin-antitoxin module